MENKKIKKIVYDGEEFYLKDQYASSGLEPVRYHFAPQYTGEGDRSPNECSIIEAYGKVIMIGLGAGSLENAESYKYLSSTLDFIHSLKITHVDYLIIPNYTADNSFGLTNAFSLTKKFDGKNCYSLVRYEVNDDGTPNTSTDIRWSIDGFFDSNTTVYLPQLQPLECDYKRDSNGRWYSDSVAYNGSTITYNNNTKILSNRYFYYQNLKKWISNFGGTTIYPGENNLSDKIIIEDFELNFLNCNNKNGSEIYSGDNGASLEYNKLKYFYKIESSQTIKNYLNSEKDDIKRLNCLDGKGGTDYSYNPVWEEINEISNEIESFSGHSNICETEYQIGNYSLCCLTNHFGATVFYAGNIMKAAKERLLRNKLLPNNISLYKMNNHGMNLMGQKQALVEPQFDFWIDPKNVVLCNPKDYNSYLETPTDLVCFNGKNIAVPFTERVSFESKAGNLYQINYDRKYTYKRNSNSYEMYVFVDWNVNNTSSYNADGTYWRPFCSVSDAIAFYSNYSDKLSGLRPCIVVKSKYDEFGSQITTSDADLKFNKYGSRNINSSLIASSNYLNTKIKIITEDVLKYGYPVSSNGKLTSEWSERVKKYHLSSKVVLNNNDNLEIVGFWISPVSNSVINKNAIWCFNVINGSKLELNGCIFDYNHLNGDYTYNFASTDLISYYGTKSTEVSSNLTSSDGYKWSASRWAKSDVVSMYVNQKTDFEYPIYKISGKWYSKGHIPSGYSTTDATEYKVFSYDELEKNKKALNLNKVKTYKISVESDGVLLREYKTYNAIALKDLNSNVKLKNCEFNNVYRIIWGIDSVDAYIDSIYGNNIYSICYGKDGMNSYYLDLLNTLKKGKISLSDKVCGKVFGNPKYNYNTTAYVVTEESNKSTSVNIETGETSVFRKQNDYFEGSYGIESDNGDDIDSSDFSDIDENQQSSSSTETTIVKYKDSFGNTITTTEVNSDVSNLFDGLDYSWNENSDSTTTFFWRSSSLRGITGVEGRNVSIDGTSDTEVVDAYGANLSEHEIGVETLSGGIKLSSVLPPVISGTTILSKRSINELTQPGTFVMSVADEYKWYTGFPETSDGKFLNCRITNKDISGNGLHIEQKITDSAGNVWTRYGNYSAKTKTWSWTEYDQNLWVDADAYVENHTYVVDGASQAKETILETIERLVNEQIDISSSNGEKHITSIEDKVIGMQKRILALSVAIQNRIVKDSIYSRYIVSEKGEIPELSSIKKESHLQFGVAIIPSDSPIVNVDSSGNPVRINGISDTLGTSYYINRIQTYRPTSSYYSWQLWQRLYNGSWTGWKCINGVDVDVLDNIINKKKFY